MRQRHYVLTRWCMVSNWRIWLGKSILAVCMILFQRCLHFPVLPIFQKLWFRQIWSIRSFIQITLKMQESMNLNILEKIFVIWWSIFLKGRKLSMIQILTMRFYRWTGMNLIWKMMIWRIIKQKQNIMFVSIKTMRQLQSLRVISR